LTDPALTRAIVELVLFLELSDENLVDPDASVSALEQLSHTLQGASADTRQSMVEQIRTMSHHDPEASKLIAELPETLGLVD